MKMMEQHEMILNSAIIIIIISNMKREGKKNEKLVLSY